MTRIAVEESREAADRSRRLRRGLVRLLGAAQERAPTRHAEVLAAAWCEAARRRRIPPHTAPREP